MAEQMEVLLKVEQKQEALEFMKILNEMDLNTEEQKVILGFIQGVKLAKEMERKVAAV